MSNELIIKHKLMFSKLIMIPKKTFEEKDNDMLSFDSHDPLQYPPIISFNTD